MPTRTDRRRGFVVAFVATLLALLTGFSLTGKTTAQTPVSIAPGKLAIYYGYPSSVNGANGNINAAVATFSVYDAVIFGDTLQLPQYDANNPNANNPNYDKACTQNSHYDHNNTVAIINALTAAGTDVYGYISIGGENTARICPTISPDPAPLSQTEIEHFVDLWQAMGVTGVFYDEAGYDFGTDRPRQNAAVDYAHGLGLKVFINAFLQEEIFEPTIVGNIVYSAGNRAGQTSALPMNPVGAATHLGPNDISLLESFQIIQGGYRDPLDWADRSDKAVQYQRQFGTLFATVTTAVDTVDTSCGFDQAQLDYAWWSTQLYGFDLMAWGEGANFSAASGCNAQLPLRARPAPAGMGDALTSPQVAHSLNIHSRQTANGRIEVDTNSHTGQFVAGAPTPPSGPSVAPAAELLHWWPGDTSAQDIIGFSHGSLTAGKSWFAPGKVGQAFSLDGRDDFIPLGSDASVTGSGPFSIDAWIRTTDDRGVIIQQRSAAEINGQYVLSVGGLDSPYQSAPGKVCWATYGDGQFGFNFCSTAAVNDGGWHHIAGVREGDGTGRIYIDGNLNSSQSAPPRSLVPIDLFIGADKRDGVAFFAGLIDELAITSRALTGPEVQALATAGTVGRQRPSTHGVWVFSDEISNPAARDTLIQRTSASGVTDLYLSVYRSPASGAGRLMYEDADIAALIGAAHSAGIHVWAAYGAPDWPGLGCASSAFPMQRMAEVVAYNNANSLATFDGVILDVEPTEPQSLADQRGLLDLYNCASDTLKVAGVGLETAIRFFWDDVVNYPLNSRVAQKLHEQIIDAETHQVVVMGYRDSAGTPCPANGIVCLDSDEVAYAHNQSRINGVVAGLETSDCAPGCGGEEVTFYEEGQATLNWQAGCVAEAYAGQSGFGGFSIHRYGAAYLSGQPLWNAENPAFPGQCNQPPDLMLPLILASAAKADLSPYNAGTWTNQTVTVHFECSDAESGVASCTGDQVLDTEGVTPSVDGTAMDNAGNSANASFGPVQIDKSEPDTAITGQPTDPSPSADASFTFNGNDGLSGVAGFECSLDGAGFAACASPQNYSGLADGSHTFQVRGVDNAGNSDSTPASATWTVQTPPASATVTIKVAEPNGTGRTGYVVRIYAAGGAELSNAVTDANGLAAFPVTPGTNYEYQVAKYASISAKIGFQVSGDQTLTYTLAKVTVAVGRPNYTVRVFMGTNGSGLDLTSAISDANGNTNFYLIEGDYGYQVERYGVISAKAGFTVVRSTDQTLTYTFAKITINVGRPNYTVRMFSGPGGNGLELGSASSDANGNTDFYLIEGDYGYQVERYGIYSAKAGFTVVRSADQTVIYTFAQITINVGRPGYVVRLFSGTDGSGLDLGSASSDANGNTNFYLIEGDYGYQVEKYGVVSAKAGFTVARSTAQTINYTLSTVTINVGRPGYVVRFFNGTDGIGAERGSASTDAGGNATFYLVEGDYGYQVDKYGTRSGMEGFTVVRNTNLNLAYTLSTVTINVGRPGYVVRFFNGTNGIGAERGSASTDAGGNATFYLVEGDYGYQVDKYGTRSDMTGFTVMRGTPLNLSYTLATVTVNVGRPGYVVRFFNGTDGSGAERGSASTDAGGNATFYLVEGDYGYQVDKYGTRSAMTGFTVVRGTPLNLSYTLATVTINVGRPGYVVRFFNGTNGGGAERGSASTDAGGNATFYLVEGDYGYQVDKYGTRSGMEGFTVVRNTNLNLSYTLSTVTINVGRPGYVVRFFNGTDGIGAERGSASTDAGGNATFYLVEGDYGYQVDKYGTRSPMQSFSVESNTDLNLSYTLATVTVNVGRPGYVVRFFNGTNGIGAERGSASTDAGGNATFYLVEGDYGYQVDKYGTRSGMEGFTVMRGTLLNLSYTLATVTVNVGRPGYVVRFFNGTNGIGAERGSASTDAGGNATFYLVEGDYGYQVDKYGTRSGMEGFTVVRNTNLNLSYTLATVTVNVGRPGYVVRFFNGTNGGGAERGSASTDANGNATFYLIEGDYGYQVDKYGTRSAMEGFTVVRNTNQNLSYTLAAVTINVKNSGGQPLPGYIVRFYNGTDGNGTQRGSASTDASGNVVFYLVEGGYQYQVEKNAYNSGKEPPGGFFVLPGTAATLNHTVP